MTVRLRSSDGFVFEANEKVACVAPIISEVRSLGEENEEIPLPSVTSNILSLILSLCEEYLRSGHWPKLRNFDGCESYLESLFRAADYLCLEQLSALCLGTLAGIVEEHRHENSVSVAAMRRALLCRTICFSTSTIVALLEGLTMLASRGDYDCLLAVCAYRDSPSPIARRAALTSIGWLAPTDDSASIGHLRRGLCDQNVQVKVAALAALARVASSESKDILSIVQVCTLDEAAAVRSAALQALGCIARCGDVQALAIARKALKDANENVRRAAIESFTYLADVGDERAALDLIALLEDMNEVVRNDARQAVVLLIGVDSDRSIEALLSHLEHRYWWVSAAAAKILKEVALCSLKQESKIIEVLASRIGHDRQGARQVALDTLVRIVSKGDIRVIERVISVLKSGPDKTVRHFASKALVKLGNGEEMVVNGLVSLLKESNQMLRQTALEALHVVAIYGRARVLEELSARMPSGSSEQKSAALSVVVHIGGRNDKSGIEMICRGLLERNTAVREAAAWALTKTVDIGRPQAIRAVFGQFGVVGNDRDSIRRMVRAIRLVADSSEQSLRLVSSLLTQKDAIVRSTVFDALMGMVDKGYRQCMFATCSCWGSSSASSSSDSPISSPISSPTSDSLGTISKFASSDSLGSASDSESLRGEQAEHAGVRIASQALSSCLLQPAIRLPDAIVKALKEAGGSSDHVGDLLNKTMGHRRWFIHWTTIEDLCLTASNDDSGPPAMTSSFAKIKRKAPSSDDRRRGQPFLHRPGCPCLASGGDGEKPSKQAKPDLPEVDGDRPLKQARLAGA